MYPHFFQSLASSLRANLHISAGGDNCHHIIEGVFKATARASAPPYAATPSPTPSPPPKE